MNGIKITFVILFVLATVITLMIGPSINKPMLIENANFVLKPVADIQYSKDKPATILPATISDEIEVKTAQTPSSSRTKIVKTETPKSQQKEIEVYHQPKIQTTQQTQTRYIRPEQQKNKTIQTEPNQLEILERILSNVQKGEYPSMQDVEKLVQTADNQQQPSKPQSSNNQEQMSQEEIIAWNKWRSDIHNKIMIDCGVNAPIGTIFTFSFVVDKFGNISNIKTSSTNADYIPEARNRIKPAIQNLQGKAILKFPKETKRQSTVVSGLFGMGLTDRFSTPGEFSDYERIRR